MLQWHYWLSYPHHPCLKNRACRDDKYRENSGCTKKYLGTLNLGLLSDCPKLFRYERKSKSASSYFVLLVLAVALAVVFVVFVAFTAFAVRLDLPVSLSLCSFTISRQA